jgi:hypothetical protein
MVVAVAVCLSLSCWDHETLLALQFTQLNAYGLVKNPKTPFSVIPVKTGIQEFQELLDSRSPPANA